MLRRHCGDGGATAVLVRYDGGHGGAAAVMAPGASAIPLRIGPTRGVSAEVLSMFKVSAVPPRRSAMLTVFRGTTAINDVTSAEPRRSWRYHCGLCRTSTAVAPRSRCDGDIGGPNVRCLDNLSRFLRRSMTKPLRNHGDHGGGTAVYAVQAPHWHRVSGVTGVLGVCWVKVVLFFFFMRFLARVVKT